MKTCDHHRILAKLYLVVGLMLPGACAEFGDEEDVYEEDLDAYENLEANAAVTLPMGGVHTWWRYPYGGYVLRVDQRLRIDDEAPSTYWALQAQLAKDGMYMGLQTDALRPDGRRGKMAIFSLWGANAAKGTYCINFSGEGVGKSCRLNFDWVRGREYVLRIRHAGDDAYGTWWRAQIVSYGSTVTTHTIGDIRAPKGAGLLRNQVNWAEVFGGTYNSCSDITFSQAVWWPPVTWTLFRSGTQTGTISSNYQWPCPNGKAIKYGTVMVHQMGYL